MVKYNIYLSQVQKLFEEDIITADEYETIMNRIIEKVKSLKGGDNG